MTACGCVCVPTFFNADDDGHNYEEYAGEIYVESYKIVIIT